MKRRALTLALLWIGLLPDLAAGQPRGHVTSTLPEFHAQEPGAHPVTQANLLASERFWPYRVELTRDWQPKPGAPSLAAGTSGILVRVETRELARIDYGRNGRFEVPVDYTNLVARANRIRLGELDKSAPNFLLAVGPRLLAPTPIGPRPFPIAQAAAFHTFLLVFAEPGSDTFPELTTALRALQQRDDLLTIFFPQGRESDAHTHTRLRELGWEVPFLPGYLSEAYTRSLVGEATRWPAVLLQTGEGRELYRSPWKPEVVSQVTATLEEDEAATAAVDARHDDLAGAR